MLNMANTGYTTATDFADYLVKEKNLLLMRQVQNIFKNSQLC